MLEICFQYLCHDLIQWIMISRGLYSAVLVDSIVEVLTENSYDLFMSGSVVTELCFCACVLQRQHLFQHVAMSQWLFWLTRPNGVDTNNNYNRTAWHSFRQGWILPSDLSSLLSQEQTPSVIMCYSEWCLFLFLCCNIEGAFFFLLVLKGPLHV